MGRMDKEQDTGNLIRALIYGPPKSKKTWWALKMAELGFNVILADLDDGAGIAKNLSPEALARIYRIDMRPNAVGYSTSGAAALSYAISGQTVYFDEHALEYTPVQRVAEDKEYLCMDLAKATPHDVLIIDTWTSFVQQMSGNTILVKSPITVDKLEWEDYQKIRLILDHFLGGLTRLNCHVIVIAHSETYAKKKPDVDPKGKKLHELIESVRLQPSSVSRAHAETMAGKFNEVIYFENHGSTLGVRISTKGSADFDAGSRYFPPGDYKWADFNAASMLSPGQIEAVAHHGEFDSPAITNLTGAQIKAMRAANVSTETSTVAVDPKKPIIKTVSGLKRS